MSFFGGLFFVSATVLAESWKSPLMAIPVVIFAVVAYAAKRLIRRYPSGAFQPDARAGKIMAWASTVEGVVIPLVALGLANTGHGDVVLPGIALVVGLHFLPMAHAIPFRAFYWLGLALVTVATVGFVVSQPFGSIGVGILAACALWTASALALRRSSSGAFPT